MRSLRARWIQVVAALLLLLGSASPALARMTCVNSGHSVLNVGQAKDCCPVDHQHSRPELKATCCELMQVQPQRSAYLTGTPLELPALDLFVVEMAIAVPERSVGEALQHAYCTRPPPPVGRRLAAIGLLLV